MVRVLVINPNRSSACSAGIDAAVAPFRFPGGPAIAVVTSPDGPPAIYSWHDWHAAVGPMCEVIKATPADAYVVACASDPGIEAARATTDRPVFGIFRAAIATAAARFERFGVIAIVEASKARHALALRAMGLEQRLVGEIALDVTMEALLDPVATRARLIEGARALAAAGAEAIVLGCTGMVHHHRAITAAVGVPVIEPCQAGVLLALGAVLSARP
jgi:Asp/Glu/hydantoin racemase